MIDILAALAITLQNNNNAHFDYTADNTLIIDNCSEIKWCAKFNIAEEVLIAELYSDSRATFRTNQIMSVGTAAEKQKLRKYYKTIFLHAVNTSKRSLDSVVLRFYDDCGEVRVYYKTDDIGLDVVKCRVIVARAEIFLPQSKLIETTVNGIIDKSVLVNQLKKLYGNIKIIRQETDLTQFEIRGIRNEVVQGGNYWEIITGSLIYHVRENTAYMTVVLNVSYSSGITEPQKDDSYNVLPEKYYKNIQDYARSLLQKITNAFE